MNPDELFDILSDTASKLSEHFESVQIFGSIYTGEDSFTHSFQVGRGNFNARYGQVKSWVIKQEQNSKNTQMIEDQVFSRRDANSSGD